MCTLPEREGQIERGSDKEREEEEEEEDWGEANNSDLLKQRQGKPTKWARQGMSELSGDDSDVLKWVILQAAYIGKRSG